LKNQYYYLLGIIFSWLWSSMAFSAPIVFKNVHDFIKDKSEIITFEAADGQTSPEAISSQFNSIETIIFEGSSKILQTDLDAISGAPFDGTSYLHLKSTNDGVHPFSRVDIIFSEPVDAVGAYWGGVDKGIVIMRVTFVEGHRYGISPSTRLYNLLPRNSQDKCEAINGFLGIDSNEGKKIKEVTFFVVGDQISLDNIYFGDATGGLYGIGETLLPSAFYKNQCDTTSSSSNECTMYGVNDKNFNNSKFFSINPEDHYSVDLLNYNHPYNGYDIESLDVHPITGELFAASSYNTTDNKDKGFLLKVNKQHGGLTPIGSTGFDAIVSLSFHPNGSLWGWVDNVGLIQIDPTNAESTLKLGSHYNIDGISWSTDGSVLYIMGKNSLYAYNPTRKTFLEKCNNFPLNTQAIDTLNDNSLLFISYENKKSTLHSFDINSCTINTTVPATFINTRFTDVKGIASSCN